MNVYSCMHVLSSHVRATAAPSWEGPPFDIGEHETASMGERYIYMIVTSILCSNFGRCAHLIIAN